MTARELAYLLLQVPEKKVFLQPSAHDITRPCNVAITSERVVVLSSTGKHYKEKKGGVQ